MPRTRTARLEGDDRGVISNDTPGGTQEKAIINESGLYSLIFTSTKPEAKRFKKWITSEVIPTIRRTGTYSVAQSRFRDASALSPAAAGATIGR